MTFFLIKNCHWHKDSHRSFPEHSGVVGLRAAVELYAADNGGYYPSSDWSLILGEGIAGYPEDFLDKIVYNDIAAGKKVPQDEKTPLLVIADFQRNQLFRVIYFDYNLEGEDLTVEGLLKLKPKFSNESWVKLEKLIYE